MRLQNRLVYVNDWATTKIYRQLRVPKMSDHLFSRNSGHLPVTQPSQKIVRFRLRRGKDDRHRLSNGNCSGGYHRAVFDSWISIERGASRRDAPRDRVVRRVRAVEPTYRSNDATSRTCGFGALARDLVLTGDYTDSFADLVMPNGAAIHYVRRNRARSIPPPSRTALTRPARFIGP